MLPIIQVSKSKAERGEMPQIKNAKKFTKFCEANGLRYRKVTLVAASLKPSQSDINLDHVFKIIKKGLDTVKHPLLIAEGHRILDGHHRWYSGQILRTKVVCYRIEASENLLIKLAVLYGAKHATIEDES